MLKSTKQHQNFWKNRRIDWKRDYFDTWNHPHRALIIDELKKQNFMSVLEVGCASGPNLYAIHKAFPKVQFGGIDISESAIATAKSLLPMAAVLETGPMDDLFLSDKSSDVVLTDMCLIYAGPWKIDKVIREIKRVARNRVILVEFHSGNIFKRLALALAAGYWAYDWKSLLQKHGFYDIELKKIEEESWPGGEPQKSFGYVITASL